MIAEPGQAVGDFVLRTKIADGGMGSVWVADDATGRQVAVKLLAKDAVHDVEHLERFSLEARVTTDIHSLHVPQLLAYGVTTDGAPFMAMELVEGVDLQSHVAAHGPLSVEEVALLVEHVATALAAAHANGVVHRDVKPTNIIIGTCCPPGERFQAYLIDFGIAKMSSDLSPRHVTHPGTTVGTPSYMSPEQLIGSGKVDMRADVWSLAVVAYWCLTASLPFKGDSFRDLCVAIYVGTFTPVTKLRPDLPSALDAWFTTALAGDADARFDSVATMSRMFKAATTDTVPVPRARPAESSFDVTQPALPALRVPRVSRAPRARGRLAKLLSALQSSWRQARSSLSA
jgi:eukaryotic-like serine/threonine-protein kinase